MSGVMAAQEERRLEGCGRCGRVDATLRGTSFMYAVSVVLFTFSNGAGAGIYCASCRKKEAAKYSLLSALVGWWGFPWGPIRTVHAIGRNSAGGHQDRDFNADLLRAVAAELLERDDKPGAVEALGESLRLRDDPALHEFLWHLTGEALTEIPATAEPVLMPGELVRCAEGTVPLRAAPRADEQPVGILDAEDAVVTRTADGWLEVRVPGGSWGWVPSSVVEARR
jgi:hypothetical protein